MGRMMRKNYCMHELLLFLDKFFIMFLLLFLSVSHHKKMHLKPIFFTLCHLLSPNQMIEIKYPFAGIHLVYVFESV